MKNDFILTTIMVVTLMSMFKTASGQYAYEYDPAIVKTPTNVTVDALHFNDVFYTDFTAPEIALENAEWTGDWNVQILENATKYYNCHGHAWHIVDGGNLVWINDIDYNYNPINNVTKYYTGSNATYVETTKHRAGLKVSYFPRDHSAVTTSTPGVLISKWAWGSTCQA